MADDDTNYVFSEVPVTARAASSQHASPDELVRMAAQIWKQVGNSGVAPGDDKGNDALLRRLQEEHKDFNTSFPIVVRWMVQMRTFNTEALRKYLLMHASANLSSREEFLRLQAEYIVLVYKETHKHWNTAQMIAYRDTLVKQLLEEDKEFMEVSAQVEADLKTKAHEYDRSRREALHALLIARGVAERDAAATRRNDDAARRNDTTTDE